MEAKTTSTRTSISQTVDLIHVDELDLINTLLLNCSFLKAQIFKFNLCTQQLISDLKSLASNDGQRVVVPMKEYIHNATSDIISQVPI